MSTPPDALFPPGDIESSVAGELRRYILRLNVDRDTQRDLWQEAVVEVWRATRRLNHYCPKYLIRCGIGAIQHYARDKINHVRVAGWVKDRGDAEACAVPVVLDSGTVDARGRTALDRARVGDRTEEVLRRIDLDREMRCLHPLDRAIIAGVLEGYTQSSMIGRLGISKAYVSVCYNRGVQRLKERLGG